MNDAHYHRTTDATIARNPVPGPSRGHLAEISPGAQAGTKKPKSHDDLAFEVFAVIDDRSLERECFVACLQQQCTSARVIGFGSIADWRASSCNAEERQVILHNIGSKSLADESVRAELRGLVAQAQLVPVVILGATDDVDAMIAALECGADGYIPPCVHFPDIVEATRMTVAGASFLSRASLMALRNSLSQAETNSVMPEMFTDRQFSVAQALRRGAANKTIAYELDLRESTVKVHIRHIFHKLKATNRTEAAFLLNQMTGWPADPRSH
ncbi:transcriptional regulator, LuxR family [Loktanella atrilutea]|uniref:Transcriptional regulator, LuxR family n=1 Tax=Loktanella atrilutea TaxID=366533 RepID=A0A1M4UQR4_LOKAT|nr:response regulator transcription factor [Loktanella atrilutea]SHE59081.1 transcriptional regulator, LuxR family [Loktanella atrilutea]